MAGGGGGAAHGVHDAAIVRRLRHHHRGRAGCGAASVEGHVAGRRRAGRLEAERRVTVPVGRHGVRRGWGRHGAQPAVRPGSSSPRTLPDAIGKLTALRELIIYHNQLAGKIPVAIGRMASLEVLRSGGNKNLPGALPIEIGSFSQLTMIGLAETSITGPLPASLGWLKNLTTLAIYMALLSGPILPGLGQCSESLFGNLASLQQLQLSVNKLSGTVPSELAPCGNLTDLELDNNQLIGSIPAVLGSLPSLRMLNLWANQLTGTIPPELGRCASLETLDLSNNALTGPIPQAWKAGFLDLGSNRLSGALPPEISGCPNLTFVDLHDNAITGELPPGLFQDLLSQQYLDLSYNVIGGNTPPPPPPSDIGMLTSLTKLILSGNRLSRPVPPEIGSCSRLQLLDVGGNTLSGCMTKITTKSDVYSFGVVLLEMTTGRRPLEPSFGEGHGVVQWVRDHLCREREPMEVIDERLQGRPDTQVHEMLQALGIALLFASPRPEDRLVMKDVAALLRGIQHDDSVKARKAGGAEAAEAAAGVRKWADPKQPISPSKLIALAQPAQAQAQARESSGSQSLLRYRE
ncbi:putative leucine-rich repeat receptor protein kinase family protein [Panicum miliaceum]|uniref:non-specific serine/threonine protein kinase n=1 Tax=Panicum miliaceum TaxID=4540 RepID=A0A3L6SMN1_PANMI|nr:putative leucine-rich repeat receptor protein kinase family protein [Panicum miliaceum]